MFGASVLLPLTPEKFGLVEGVEKQIARRIERSRHDDLAVGGVVTLSVSAFFIYRSPLTLVWSAFFLVSLHFVEQGIEAQKIFFPELAIALQP